MAYSTKGTPTYYFILIFPSCAVLLVYIRNYWVLAGLRRFDVVQIIKAEIPLLKYTTDWGEERHKIIATARQATTPETKVAPKISCNDHT